MSQAGVNNSNPGGKEVLFLEGNSGGAVPPEMATGIIHVVGAGGTTVVGNIATNTLTITVAGEGMSWNTISSSQTLQVNNGYICISPGGALSLLLPPVSHLGDEMKLTLDGAASFSITQGAGQQIRIGNTATTAGVGGSITTTQQGDTIILVCQTANLKWNVIGLIGNPTVV